MLIPFLILGSTLFGPIAVFADQQFSNPLPAPIRNAAVGSCNGQSYATHFQLCCEGQIWEDPYGLYTCCGNVPCLTDVGVSVYQVFKGKYTDGVSQYIGTPFSSRFAGTGPAPLPIIETSAEQNVVGTSLQNVPVYLPRDTSAIQFSRTPMRNPPYMVYSSRSVGRIPVGSYYLPPPRRRLHHHPVPLIPIATVPVMVQQTAMEMQQFVQPMVASPVALNVGAENQVGTNQQQPYAITNRQEIPELTIRIETEPSQNQNSYKFAEAPRVADETQKQSEDVNAELLRILRNIETVSDVDDETQTTEVPLQRRTTPAQTTVSVDLLEDQQDQLQLQQPASYQVVPFWNPHVPPTSYNLQQPQQGQLSLQPIAFRPNDGQLQQSQSVPQQQQQEVQQPVTYVVEVPGDIAVQAAKNSNLNVIKESSNNEITRRRRRYRRRRLII